MPEVVICVPAYESPERLVFTLRSALAQTFRDLEVRVAIEPAERAPAVLQACEQLRDDRVRASVNPTRLGWAPNVQRLLERVDARYYAILPHDDILHPRYVETLRAALSHEPAAALAYADMYVFDAVRGRERRSAHGNEPFERALSFLLAGAEGTPWRGLTDARVLRDGVRFPTEPHLHFAVECVYVLDVLLAGPLVRVPKVLYWKRVPEATQLTVSATWGLAITADTLDAALAHHRGQLEERLRRLHATADQARLIDAALSLAMARRSLVFRGTRFAMPEGTLAEVRAIADAADRDDLVGRALLGRAHTILGHASMQRGELDRADEHAATAALMQPECEESLVLRARIALRRGDAAAALLHALAAAEVHPCAVGLDRLLEECHRAFRDAHEPRGPVHVPRSRPRTPRSLLRALARRVKAMLRAVRYG